MQYATNLGNIDPACTNTTQNHQSEFAQARPKPHNNTTSPSLFLDSKSADHFTDRGSISDFEVNYQLKPSKSSENIFAKESISSTIASTISRVFSRSGSALEPEPAPSISRQSS